MAMVRITPIQVDVACDSSSGRPQWIRLAREAVPVLRVARVRDEAAAYPAGSGPRTLFEIQTPDARLALTFEHRGRRWLLEGLDPSGPVVTPAA
ncbi:MAG: hypothetical protein M3301_09995 [Chloroflexota bacterium]|nr:hypothetical protein [Chloroflexota bacterium]